MNPIYVRGDKEKILAAFRGFSDIMVLSSAPLRKIKDLPSETGVYFVLDYNFKRVRYIGSTCLIRERWTSGHEVRTRLKDAPDGVRIHYMLCDTERTARSIEAGLINSVRPTWNVPRVYPNTR